MATFQIKGEEVIDRNVEVVVETGENEQTEPVVTVPETDGAVVRVPDHWVDQQVKIIRTGDEPQQDGAGDLPEDFDWENDEEYSSRVKTNEKQSERAQVLEIVSTLEAETKTDDELGAAPISDVFSKANEQEISTETCEEILDEFRRKGQVYEPSENTLRVT